MDIEFIYFDTDDRGEELELLLKQVRERNDAVLKRTGVRGYAVSLRGGDFRLGARHHVAVGANLRAGGLTARRAGMKRRLIMFSHGTRPQLRRGAAFEEAAIETLFGAGRFRFQPIEHLFVEKHLGAFGHRTFFDDVIDTVQHGVGRDFPFAEPVQGLDLFCKALH